jgi:hypothetical protein
MYIFIVKVKGKVVPVLNLALCHYDLGGGGCIDTRFFDLGASWR